MNRRFLTLIAAFAITPLVAQAQEPAYPTKPIRLIAPSPPGTPPDLVGRVIGEKLTVALGQPVIVDNRPGATGTIGLNAVAKATPDGYTLGIIAMPFIIAPSFLAQVPYDTERDLAPVALTNWNYNVLVVPAGSPAKSVADLVAAAKTRPGALKFPSAGNGTPSHLAGELLKLQSSVNITHIPYKGAPAAVVALLGGEVDMMIGATGAMAVHIKSGKLRALATTAPQRIAAYPELPTFVELGYPSVQIRDWQGVVAPARTPKNVIAQLHAEIAKATALPDVKARLEGMGMEAAGAGPEQFAALIRSEIPRWARVVRDAGIKAD